MARKKQPLSAETALLEYATAGTVFYTLKDDKSITASACYRGRKVKTERMLAISKWAPYYIEDVVKVTILE